MKIAEKLDGEKYLFHGKSTDDFSGVICTESINRNNKNCIVVGFAGKHVLAVDTDNSSYTNEDEKIIFRDSDWTISRSRNGICLISTRNGLLSRNGLKVDDIISTKEKVEIGENLYFAKYSKTRRRHFTKK